MRLIEKQIKTSRTECINIYPLGDSHLGSIDCAENELQKQVEIILNDPKGYWIGMGDICDSITKSDKRFRMGGLAPWVNPSDIVESQRKRAGEILSPISDKCLAYLTGNHEESIHKFHQDDISRHISNDLNVPYAGYQAFIHLLFYRGMSKRGISDKHPVLIHAWHGAGAAQTEGARIMRLMRLVNEIRADIYLMGHLHAIGVYAPDTLKVVNRKIKSTRIIAVLTGSFLKGYAQEALDDIREPSYIEEKGYKPARIGSPVIHIFPMKGQFTVES